MGDMADDAREAWEFEQLDRVLSAPRRARGTLGQPGKAGVWRSADGTERKFSEMEHAHLLNTIALLERQYRSLQDTFCDEALDIDLLFPAHAGLVAEARRRRLVPRRRSKDGMVTR